ncbi:MAG TPA: NAD(P)-dependent oxidoreductase [Rhizomicrobium sp.]|nr:NAD(P)-dependent oxidoreductase [Rhizomicrobium sp.]
MKHVMKSGAAGLLLAVSLVAVGPGSLPALAQEDGPRNQGLVNTPIPEPNMANIIKTYGLTETSKPAREFIKGWRKPKKILVGLDNNTNRMAWLKEVVPPDVELIPVRRGDPGYADLLKEADGVFGSCNKDSFGSIGPNFHWLHNTGVGIDQCFTGGIIPDRLKDGSVAISNSSRLEGNSVAGHGIALMMALSRGLDQYVLQDKTQKFTTETYPRMWSLQGRTIVIAGLGGVGSGMATLASGLGMRVLATNGSIPANPPDYIEHIGLPDELGTLVGQADVVMTALPLTAQTTGLFNAAMFAKFKKGAIFINVAREEEQVDADLAAALESGQVSSTGQDSVVPDSPLWKEKNIIITPHVAAQNVDAMLSRGGEQIWAVARENLKRFINGDKMLSVIDPVKGY